MAAVPFERFRFASGSGSMRFRFTGDSGSVRFRFANGSGSQAVLPPVPESVPEPDSEPVPEPRLGALFWFLEAKMSKLAFRSVKKESGAWDLPQDASIYRWPHLFIDAAASIYRWPHLFIDGRIYL